MPNEDLAIRFIISTKSGRGHFVDQLESKILAAFSAFPKPDIRRTERKGHIEDLCLEWAQVHAANGLCYVCGGDGAISEAAKALVGTGTHLGVIPLGTGNDFARTLYGDLSAEKIREKIIPYTPKPRLDKIDVIKANDKVGINVISMGHDSVVLEKALDNLKRWPRLGSFAYILAILQTLTVPKVYRYRYHFLLDNGEVLEGEQDAIISVFANAKYYGTGFLPAPDADMQDGYGNWIFVDPLRFREFVPLLLRYKKGKHLGHPKVQHYRFTSGWIEETSAQEMIANHDGIVWKPKRMELEVLHKDLAFAFVEPDAEVKLDSK